MDADSFNESAMVRSAKSAISTPTYGPHWATDKVTHKGTHTCTYTQREEHDVLALVGLHSAYFSCKFTVVSYSVDDRIPWQPKGPGGVVDWTDQQGWDHLYAAAQVRSATLKWRACGPATLPDSEPRGRTFVTWPKIGKRSSDWNRAGYVIVNLLDKVPAAGVIREILVLYTYPNASLDCV